MPEEKAVEVTQTDQEPSAAPSATLTEADLAKSLATLEGKKEEEKVVEEPQAPTVTATTLEKNTAQAIKDNGSGGLKRSLEVSQVLSEFSTVIGDHVDTSLGALQKSVQASAERDLALINVITNLQKSVEILSEKMEEYGNTPARTPKAANVSKSEVLQKSTETDSTDTRELDPVKTRQQVGAGLVELMKSMEPGSAEASALQHKALMFEGNGQIDDQTLHKAMTAYNKSVA